MFGQLFVTFVLFIVVFVETFARDAALCWMRHRRPPGGHVGFSDRFAIIPDWTGP